MIHRDVVDEPRAKIEAGEQIVLAAKVDAVMAGATQSRVRLTGGFKNNVFHRAETSIGENAAVGICDRQIARPAVGHAGKRDGIVTSFGKMSGVRRVRKFKAKILHSGFRDRRLKAADLWMPLRFDIKPQWPVEIDLMAFDFSDAAGQRGVGAAVEIGDIARVTGIKLDGK